MPPKTRSRRTPSPLPVSRGRSPTPVLPSNLQVYTRGGRQAAPTRRVRQSARGRARGARGVSRSSPSPAPPPEQQPAAPRGRKKPTEKDLINEARQKSKREYASYKKLSVKWKILEFTEDKEAENIYKNWSQKLDSFTPVVNIKDHIDNVAKWNKFFDKDFENVWENKIYMLHLPDGHPYQDAEGFTQVDIEKIANGDYLGKNDNAKEGSIQQETENSYLSNVLNLDTYKERVLGKDEYGDRFKYKDVEHVSNLNWLIDNEKYLITDLIKQTMKQTPQHPDGLAIATFNSYLKAIRRYLKIMLGDDHELRIKYSVLYGMIDKGIEFVKGGNEAGGDDIMYYADLLDICNWLQHQWLGRYNKNITKERVNNPSKTTYTIMTNDATEERNQNEDDAEKMMLNPVIVVQGEDAYKQAWRACLNFLGVAVMVWDYPSRSDKYSTKIIDTEDKATEKETYLVVNMKEEISETNMPVWIYKGDIKDVGRPFVRVPMEWDGLGGNQRQLAKAIHLSLTLFPREHLFANKTYHWNPSDQNKNKKNDGKVPKVLAATVIDWVSKVNIDPDLIQHFKKLNPTSNINRISAMGINLFRRSFVTYWSQNMNYNNRRKMVHGMLTSFTKTETYYRRDFTEPELRQKVKIAPERRNTEIIEGQNPDVAFMNRLPETAVKARQALQRENAARQGSMLGIDLDNVSILSERIPVTDQNGQTRDLIAERAAGQMNILPEYIAVARPIAPPSVDKQIEKTRKTNAERQKKYVEAQKADSGKKKEYLAQRKAIDEKKSVKKMLLELNSGAKLWEKTQAATKTKYDLKKKSDGKYVSGKYPEFD